MQTNPRVNPRVEDDISCNWGLIAAQVQAGDRSAIDALYTKLRNFRFYLQRHIGPVDAEDAYHQLILDLVVQLQRGALRQPACLPSYARQIARRKIAGYIATRMRQRQGQEITEAVAPSDPQHDPEREVMDRELRELAARILNALPERDRTVLVRYYVKGEKAEDIQASAQLTETQFRLIKSRAKARFEHLCRESMKRRYPSSAVA